MQEIPKSLADSVDELVRGVSTVLEKEARKKLGSGRSSALQRHQYFAENLGPKVEQNIRMILCERRPDRKILEQTPFELRQNFLRGFERECAKRLAEEVRRERLYARFVSVDDDLADEVKLAMRERAKQTITNICLQR